MDSPFLSRAFVTIADLLHQTRYRPPTERTGTSLLRSDPRNSGYLFSFKVPPGRRIRKLIGEISTTMQQTVTIYDRRQVSALQRNILQNCLMFGFFSTLHEHAEIQKAVRLTIHQYRIASVPSPPWYPQTSFASRGTNVSSPYDSGAAFLKRQSGPQFSSILVELQIGSRLHFLRVARTQRTRDLKPPPWKLPHIASAAGVQTRRLLQCNTDRDDKSGDADGASR